MDPQWLTWAKRLQAIAQNGLTYNQNQFDIERYEEVRTIAAEIMAGGAGPHAADLRCVFALQEGYATPKVDVRGIIFREGKILLVRELLDGCWAPPGGWADVCESSSESVVREVFEESGFQTRALRLLAVYDRSKHPHEPQFPFHVYKMFYLCEIIGGEALPSNETSEVGFFSRDELPELSLTRILPSQIHRMFELYEKNLLLTDYD